MDLMMFFARLWSQEHHWPKLLGQAKILSVGVSNKNNFACVVSITVASMLTRPFVMGAKRQKLSTRRETTTKSWPASLALARVAPHAIEDE